VLAATAAGTEDWLKLHDGSLLSLQERFYLNGMHGDLPSGLATEASIGCLCALIIAAVLGVAAATLYGAGLCWVPYKGRMQWFGCWACCGEGISFVFGVIWYGVRTMQHGQQAQAAQMVDGYGTSFHCASVGAGFATLAMLLALSPSLGIVQLVQVQIYEDEPWAPHAMRRCKTWWKRKIQGSQVMPEDEAAKDLQKRRERGAPDDDAVLSFSQEEAEEVAMHRVGKAALQKLKRQKRVQQARGANDSGGTATLGLKNRVDRAMVNVPGAARRRSVNEGSRSGPRSATRRSSSVGNIADIEMYRRQFKEQRQTTRRPSMTLQGGKYTAEDGLVMEDL